MNPRSHIYQNAQYTDVQRSKLPEPNSHQPMHYIDKKTRKSSLKELREEVSQALRFNTGAASSCGFAGRGDCRPPPPQQWKELVLPLRDYGRVRFLVAAFSSCFFGPYRWLIVGQNLSAQKLGSVKCEWVGLGPTTNIVVSKLQYQAHQPVTISPLSSNSVQLLGTHIYSSTHKVFALSFWLIHRVFKP